MTLLLLLSACTADPPAGKETGDDTGRPDSGDSADTGDTGAPDLAAWCAEEGFGLHVPFDAVGPYGERRHELAEDFTLPLHDGSELRLSEAWTGCESFVFVPDAIPRAEGDDRPMWSRDVNDLIAASPRNAHYLFVSVERDEAVVAENLETAANKIANALEGLPADEADWWRERLHVVGVRGGQIGGWVEAVLMRGIGVEGFAIDRFQRIRGIGSFADVTRYDASASWPFENNLAYAAHEARFFNLEAERQVALDALDPTVVPLFTGEVISQYADVEVTLPDAATMAGFDTFEIHIDMRCPDPDAPEFNNCGAWDYIANLYVQADDASWIELGRFITTYHREARWVLDATPMMAHLLEGGPRTFRWSWAPEWNVQPTETRVELRFSDQGRGVRPRAATLVATGGSFGSTYNDGRAPVEVDIPAATRKAELWAVISGHGMGTDNCAEFCNHQHEFTVDAAVHTQEYAMAGTEEGCIADIEGQMTPNQWGTWWYGRGGWCPGGVVHPYAVDVTGEVTVGGTASVSYRGLRGGAAPADGSGDIVMNAWLVTYE